MKKGKATGSFVKPEHVLQGSPLLALHLHLLFNGLIQHEYVPHEFLSSVITPVVKDSSGNFSDTKNYRPVTLSSLFSQLFEHAVNVKIGHLLLTDDLQFGFKSKHSTTHALFVLQETVNYFTKHGSNTYVSFLDCSKAFDKVSHKGLFIKLMERNVPIVFLNIIIYWFSNLSSTCRWQSGLSAPFPVTSGVKQGGILSPNFFTVYVDELLTILRRSGLGCHVGSIFAGAIMSADDLAIVTPTRSSMQLLINMCDSYCRDYGLSFNTAKTKSLIFGKDSKSLKPFPLLLNDQPIEYVTEWKYLGCLINSGSEFAFSCKSELTAFRRSANCILSSVRKPHEQVSMRLLYTYAVPILTYASEVKVFSHTEMSNCNVALNDAIRRIFSYHRWESIRTLRQQFGYKDLTTIFALRKRKFLARLPTMGNKTVSLRHDYVFDQS